MKACFIFLVLMTIAVGYSCTTKPQDSSTEQTGQAQEFRCTGKVYCSEMGSCQEALFYLKNCPGVKIDGDGDKIPCEKEWCGHSISNNHNFQ